MCIIPQPHVSLLQKKPMREAHKRSRNPNIRKKYRVKNWIQYDRALRKRGDITIWFSKQAIAAWSPKKNGKPGRQKKYSGLAIETVLTIRLLSISHYAKQRASFILSWC